MGRFNINDYTLVKDRLIAFREDFPQSTIDIKLLASNNIVDSPTGEMCNEYIMMATVTPNPLAEPEVFYVGHAAERDNGHFVNKSSAVENCETSALGRALAHCGYGGDKNGPSAEEMTSALSKQAKFKITTKELEILDGTFKAAKPFLSEKEIKIFNERRGAGYYDTKTKWYKSVMHFIMLTKPKVQPKEVKNEEKVNAKRA
jgi:hypothetical protein